MAHVVIIVSCGPIVEQVTANHLKSSGF